KKQLYKHTVLRLHIITHPVNNRSLVYFKISKVLLNPFFINKIDYFLFFINQPMVQLGVSLDIENYCTVSLFFEQAYL
ncbi:TPA: hypothetical protein ACTW6K_005779, partial [Raoultella planticola]